LFKAKRAASTIEYALLIIMFLTAILLMKKQIARTFFGRWKDLGSSFGQGEQYDPNATVDCGRYVAHSSAGWNPTETWYLQKCYSCCLDVKTLSCSDLAPAGLTVCRAKIASDPALGRECCAQACASAQCNF